MDRTLPVNLDGSCNPDLLSEISYGEHGNVPMMENVNSGRSSPIRGRTMKEYEQHIGQLKRENFNLKLRIYFLEERIGQKFSEEDIIKTNIELKVECESYKKDIEEKKQLLEKASSAIETLNSQFNEKFEIEVQAIKDDCDDKVKQAEKKVDDLEAQLQESKEKLREVEDLRHCLEEKDREVFKLAEKLKQTEQEFAEFRLDSDKERGNLKEELDGLSTSIFRKDRDIKRLSVIVEDKKLVDVGVTPLERSQLKDAVEDAQKTADKLQKRCEEKDEEMLNKDEMMGKLEDLLRDKEKELGDTKKELNIRMKAYTKAKASFIDVLQKLQLKNQEAEELERKVKQLELDLQNARDECERAKMDRQKENDRMLELEEKAERLARSLGKKEGELENFKDLLEQAQRSLCKSEDAVEALQAQLEQERKLWKAEKNKYDAQQDGFGPQTGIKDPHQHFHINIHSSHSNMDGAPSKSDVPMQDDVSELHKQIRDLQNENKRLENLLQATEQTAHCQTQKMKNYRRMLADHGLLPPGMQRSNSDQNLATETGWSPRSDTAPTGRRSRFRSAENMGPRGRSASPISHYRGVDLTDSDKLRHENEKLREENKGYKNVLKFIQNGRQSPDSSLDDQDGEAGKTEMPYKMLSKWLDQLDKFLSNIGTPDFNQSLPLTQQSTTEVNRLRKGLVQARGAIHSLSTSGANLCGRDSPDSGCSDHNPASTQNNSLKSPLNSPRNSKSAENSPRSDRSSPRSSNYDNQTEKETGTFSYRERNTLNQSNRYQFPSHSEILRGSSGECFDDRGISMLHSMDMTDVFRSEKGTTSDTNRQKSSVRFSMANERHDIPNRESLCVSPTDNHDADNTYYKTLSQSRLEDMTGIADPDEFPQNAHSSLSNALLDITLSAKAGSHHHIETMNRIIQSYEKNIAKRTVNPDVLHEHMLELQRLRIQLERQLKHIEMLQEQLNEMGRVSEEKLQEKDHVIQSLREQLSETEEVMNEKIQIISDLKIELTAKIENIQFTEMEAESLRSKVHHLEKQHEHEKKYEGMLIESRSQIERLAVELEEIKEELRNTARELDDERAESQYYKDTIDGQTKQLYDRDSEIEELHNGIRKKDEVLQNQNQLCNDLEKTLENLVGKNKEMSNQMEEQKLNCADYRKQIEKQNLMNKELKERVDRLREELSQSISNREFLEKELVNKSMKSEDDEKKKDKLKYNLGFLKTEYAKLKFKLSECEKKVKEKSQEISTLQLALQASEKMISEHELTDDEKQNYILLLLQNVKELQQQLTRVLEQNDKITQQMTLMTQRADRDQNFSSIPQSGSRSSDINVHVETNVKVGDGRTEVVQNRSSSSMANTWPALGDTSREYLRTDNLSSSLPIRERTPGGPSQSDVSLKSLQASCSSLDHPEKSLNSSLPSVKGQMSHDLLDLVTPDGSCHFSVPGPIYKQRMTDECLLYNVNDSPRQLASMTRFRIDSDIRSLFAIGMIDHFEKLKKETHECHAILKGMSCRISERLKKFTKGPASEENELEASQDSSSIEYGTLKELSFSVDNLRICVDGQLSMIAGFWISELPAPNEKGEFVNQRLLDEKAALEEELATLKFKYQSLSKGSLNEEVLCESLMSTLEVVTQARKNLEQKSQ